MKPVLTSGVQRVHVCCHALRPTSGGFNKLQSIGNQIPLVSGFCHESSPKLPTDCLSWNPVHNACFYLQPAHILTINGQLNVDSCGLLWKNQNRLDSISCFLPLHGNFVYLTKEQVND
ncbi:hypothetical protein ACE6H2_019371 [Prunus campanulata]